MIDQINTERDSRDWRLRPLASDVLLSFWKYEAKLSIESLRGVVFQTVENPNTQRVRGEVYRNLNMDLSEPLLLDRDTNNEAKEREFCRVRDESKLGRCMETLATEYIETKQCRFEVASIGFAPWAHGDGFHLVVMLRQSPAPRPRRRR